MSAAAWLRGMLGRLTGAPRIGPPGCGDQHPPTEDALWQATLRDYPFLLRLDTCQQHHLRQLAARFLQEKEFTGTGGLCVSDRMALAVAAQACVLLLRWGGPRQALRWYGDFVGIVLHPGDVLAPRSHMDDNGILHHWREPLAGEAMPGGPIMLSWQAVQAAAGVTPLSVWPAPSPGSGQGCQRGHESHAPGGPAHGLWLHAGQDAGVDTSRAEEVYGGVYGKVYGGGADGEPAGDAWPAHTWGTGHDTGRDTQRDTGAAFNVVLHEFAHKLDMAYGGQANGCPPLPVGFLGHTSAAAARAAWADIWLPAYDDFCDAVIAHERFGQPAPWLDSYAAQDPAEFFAVACEAYWMQPHALRCTMPAVARALDGLFRDCD